MRVAAVDLFSGAGGLTYGLERTGIEVVAGFDIDSACEFPYEANTDADFRRRDIGGVLDGGSESDVRDLSTSKVKDLYPDGAVRALVGCAPCQPFSDLNNARDSSDHEKWGLLEAMRRVSEELKPELVAIENVEGLADDEIYTGGFREWFEDHEEYHVWDGIVDCTNYGVPQSRKRLIMLASKLGEIELIPPTRTGDDVVTVRRTFAEADLPEIDAGEAASEVDPMHKAAGLRGKNPERMRHTREGEDWHDWPDRLKLASQDEDNTYTAYGRMWWDEPAPTLTTQFYNWGSGRFGHPGYEDDPEESIDRAISLREGALLQTFPKDYAFVEEGEDPVNHEMGRLIGNAVPVRVGSAIGGSFHRHLDHLGIDVTTEGDVAPQRSPPSYDRLVPPEVSEDGSHDQTEATDPPADATRAS